MSWNYRVVEEIKSNKSMGEFIIYSICEVYYDPSGKPAGYCEASLGQLESVEDIWDDYDLMLDAHDKPVLKTEDFVGEL